ncbi:MAG: hypothetical protein ACE5R4_13230 [Armatimonadota bacterium]
MAPMEEQRGAAAEQRERRMRALRRQVERVEALLRTTSFTDKQRRRLIDDAREACQRLCPDKLDLFDRVFAPRFDRAIQDYRKSHPDAS